LAGNRTPQHQQLADVLDGGGASWSASWVHGFAGEAVVAEDAHLDQAVGGQRGVGLLDDGRGQAVVADHDDGVQVVGFGAVHLAFGDGELEAGMAGIIDRRHTKGTSLKVKTKSKKVNKAWLNDHVNDPYVKLALKEGYRARAAYKLKEIDEQLGLIRPATWWSTSGRHPGAWSQYVRRKLSPEARRSGALNGTILALDILPMEPVEGVTFLQGDFREPEVLAQLKRCWPAARPTWWCPTWRPTCPASNRPMARISAPGRAGGRIRPGEHEARGRPGGEGVPRQRLQPAGQAVQGNLSDREASKTQGVARQVVGNLPGRAWA
jgi:hypothetical protein